MKTFLVTFIFSFILALGANSVLAERSQEGTRPAKIREAIGQRIEEHSERKMEREDDRDERKERLHERRMDLKDRIASRTAELLERLAQFKDKKKANIAERINSNLNKINERRTSAMLKHLNRMSEIVSKLQRKVNDASASGKNTTEAQGAIASASAAIDTAKLAVENQSVNEYTVVATSEANIKEDSRAARNKLHQDLKIVHNLVVEARKALANAIRTTASTLGGIGNGT